MPRWPLFFCFAAASALAAEPDSARLVARYKQMLEAHPAEGLALDRLWKIGQETGTNAVLLDEYKAAADHFSGAMVYGYLLRKAGRAEEARSAFESAAALDPKNELPHFALAELDMEHGAAADAARQWEMAGGLLPRDDPRRLDIWLQMGSAWLAANEAGKASEAWEQACAQNPNDLALRQRLAELYEKNGLAQKAISHWEFIAANGAPAQRVPAWQNLARLHQASGEVDAAMADLEHALTLTGPDHWLRADLQGQLIRLCERFQRTAELEQRWKNAAAENPRDAGAMVQLVDFYERELNTEQECVWLEKLGALRPGDLAIKTKLALLEANSGRLERAAALLDEALGVQPENVDLVFQRADIEVRQNALAAAQARVEKLWPQADETRRAQIVAWLTNNQLFNAVEKHLQEGAHDEDGRFALAKWYFTQRRPDAAERILRELAQEKQPAVEHATRLKKIAAIRRENDDLNGAIAALQLAAAAQPLASENHLALADSLLDAKRFAEAQSEAEQAFAAGRTPKERLAADEKLFEILRKNIAVAPSATPTLRSASERVNWLTHAQNSEPENMRIRDFTDALARETAAHPTVEAWLRVARWYSWQRENAESLVAARAAWALDPQSIEAHEIVARAEAAAGRQDAATADLRELEKLDPARRNHFERQIGQMEMEAAHFAAALKIFSDLQAAQPGHADALADLAVAQQQAGRWNDALNTWQRAVSVSSSEKKLEVMRQLLRAMEHLQQFKQAAEFCLKTMDAAADEKLRQALLPDLLGLAQRRQLLDWLQTELEQRQRAHPDDYFIATATAKVMQANGRESAALTLLANAAYSAHDEIGALRELVGNAEALGDLATASRFQRRLLALTPGDPAAHGKLADLQESSLDIAAAGTTWNQFVQRFPRDVAGIARAADFFHDWAERDRARELWRSLRWLDPRNTTALFDLAEETDDPREAMSCYEQVLQNTNAVADEKIPLFGSRVATSETERTDLDRPFAAPISFKTGSSSDLRFAAIRALAENLAARGQPEERAAWRSRWEKALSPAEAFWACFHAGDWVAAASHLHAWEELASHDQNAGRTVRWWTWEMRDFTALPEQLSTASPEAKTMILREFAEWLKFDRGAAAVPLVNALSATEMDPAILWSLAGPLARAHGLAAATHLGQRAFKARPIAAEGLSLAHWLLLSGNEEGARTVLETIIQQPGDSFDQPVYEALRERFLLLPAPEREPFVASFERCLDRAHPLHAALAMSLLHGLAGDEGGAERELTRLLALRPVSAEAIDGGTESSERYWAFALTTGLRLQAWRLDPLAIFFWERATSDAAAIKLQGASAIFAAHEIERRLLAWKLRQAGPSERENLFGDFIRQCNPRDLAQFGELLEASGDQVTAANLWRTAWRHDPGNVVRLRNWLVAAHAADDEDDVKQAVAEGSEILTGDAPEARSLLLESVGFLKESSAGKAVLERALQRRSTDVPVLAALARWEEQRGDPAQAEALDRRLFFSMPRQFAHAVAWARALNRTGQTKAAIEVIESSHGGSEGDLPLAEFYLHAGRLDAAADCVAKVLRRGRAEEVVELVTEAAAAGQTKAGLRWLFGQLKKTKEPAAQFSLRTKFAELAADEFPELSRAMLGQARARAETEPDRWATLLPLQGRVASRLGLSERELLLGEWKEGRGAPQAAEKLIEIFAQNQQQPELVEVVNQICARPEIDEAVLERAAKFLQKTGPANAARQLWQTLVARDPDHEKARAGLVATLTTLGRKTEALAQLRTLAAQTAWDESAAALAAPLFLALDEREAAREMFMRAVQADPLAHDFATHLAAARMLRDDAHMGEAEKILRAAFRNPAHCDAASLVDFYAEVGQLDRLKGQWPSFAFSPAMANAVTVALVTRWEKDGQFAEALAWLVAHPERLQQSETLRARLRPLAAQTNQFAEMAAVLETIAFAGPDCGRELARLYFDWAQNSTGQTELAGRCLARANELLPGDLEIARDFCHTLIEQNQRARAIGVMNRFLRSAAGDAEKEAARRLLAEIREK